MTIIGRHLVGTGWYAGINRARGVFRKRYERSLQGGAVVHTFGRLYLSINTPMPPKPSLRIYSEACPRIEVFRGPRLSGRSLLLLSLSIAAAVAGVISTTTWALIYITR